MAFLGHLGPLPAAGRNPWSMGPLGPFWPETPANPELASGNHQRPPAQRKSRILLSFRGRLFLPQCTPYSRIQEWCIDGIIYHYVPFLLSNTMVEFSGPNYVIPNQVPNPSPILKEDVSAIQSGNFLVATRRPFKDPSHLALKELGCQFSSGLF
ncbi:hypothetical protein O181_039773 [Austropuccinia psidii MF-1]|uniref:Uncharacterized protein n=1 Tax=Austropuccinia psidii MF-1 TaxID=1389203 RepID=A0A9Q3DE16_9BASI|nr:hypothetical protein [Austropuccinia psidii MF-1]